ncbi:MAG: TetR/AcrR family transcriptional regulator [Chloroflexota bacterium]
METSTKDRILDTTAAMFRRYGYTGTGLKQVVQRANAPFGSLYHHFPGGKEELGGEVIRRSGKMYEDLVMAIFASGATLEEGLANVFSGAAAVLRETDYADACPIATVALEVASTSEPLRKATVEVFDGWIVAATLRFVTAGISETKARDLAIGMIAALEGAFVLARATRSTEALEVAGKMSLLALEAARG